MPGGIYLCQANKEVSCEKRPLFVIPTKVGIHNELNPPQADWIPVCIRQSPFAERVSPIRYSKRIFSWASANKSIRSFLRIDFAYRCVMFYNIIKILSSQLIYKWTSRKSPNGRPASPKWTSRKSRKSPWEDLRTSFYKLTW